MVVIQAMDFLDFGVTFFGTKVLGLMDNLPENPPCYCGQDSMVSDANPSSTCTKTGHQGQVSGASASNISVDIKFSKFHNQATSGSHQVLRYIMPYIDIYAHTIYTYITWFSKIVEYGVPLCSDDSMIMIQSLF